jgi:hypothetical protein
MVEVHDVGVGELLVDLYLVDELLKEGGTFSFTSISSLVLGITLATYSLSELSVRTSQHLE